MEENNNNQNQSKNSNFKAVPNAGSYGTVYEAKKNNIKIVLDLEKQF